MSEKFTSFLDGEEVPSYEESTSTTPSAPSSSDRKSERPQNFYAQVTEIRTRRIQSLLATHIEPLLYSHLLDGIYSLTFIIIPSDVLTQQSHLSAKEIVGLPDTTNVSVTRLHGDENRLAFWHQPPVLQELESSLRARLAASGHRVEPTDIHIQQSPIQQARPYPPPPTSSSSSVTPQSPSPNTSSTPASPSWLKRQLGTPGPQHDPTATTDYKLGWRSREEDLPSSRRSLGPGEMRVLVSFRDVSFRVETEMGLLDSVTGKVLQVEVEVGT
jgi:hypothetical protein